MKFKTMAIAIAAIAIATGITSCKKETVTPDDPNIMNGSFTKTMTIVPVSAAADSVDLNKDGLTEIQIQFQNTGADTGAVIMAQYHQNIQFVVDGLTPAPYMKIFKQGDAMPTSAGVYQAGAYPSIKVSGYRFGLVNGEGYIVFRFTTGTKYQYGWMKVSINSAYTEFKILDFAYSILPDTPITVGSK
ncbi:MAG: hypothetical protein U0T73_08845 [Chitinophagales bacterium]